MVLLIHYINFDLSPTIGTLVAKVTKITAITAEFEVDQILINWYTFILFHYHTTKHKENNEPQNSRIECQKIKDRELE